MNKKIAVEELAPIHVQSLPRSSLGIYLPKPQLMLAESRAGHRPAADTPGHACSAGSLTLYCPIGHFNRTQKLPICAQAGLVKLWPALPALQGPRLFASSGTGVKGSGLPLVAAASFITVLPTFRTACHWWQVLGFCFVP